MKKFITTISRRKLDRTEAGVFRSENSKKLENIIYTRYPIIPVIDCYTEDGEEIEIIAIASSQKYNENEIYRNCREQLEELESELSDICNRRYIKYTVKTILTPFGETLDNHLEMFSNIISAVSDNDTLFVDITAGPKPMPIVQMIALNYCMKNKKNVMVECISYGEIDHETKDRRLFDVTSLFYLDKVSDALAYSKISDPEAFIKALIAGEVWFMAYDREDLQKIDDLAIEYHNEEDTARKQVLKERIAVLFMNNLEYIIHSGKLKNLLVDKYKTDIVKSACFFAFVFCLNKYNPYHEKSGVVPYLGYFYRVAYWKAVKDLSALDNYYCDDTDEEAPIIVEGNDISEMYEVCDEAESTSEYVETKQSVNEKLALFVGCIVQFQAHKDMTKSTNQTHLDYFQSFYTGDIVYLTKGEGFLKVLENYEQLIQKSCSTEFLDYIYKDEVRSLSEMFSGKLKYYKELKNIGIFGESKLEKTLNLPIEQNVYATYFDVSKVAISKKVDAFKDYKRQLLGEEIGAWNKAYPTKIGYALNFFENFSEKRLTFLK